MKKMYILTSLMFVIFGVSAQDLVQVFEGSQKFEGVQAVKVLGDFCKVDIKKGNEVSVDAFLKASKQMEGYSVDMVVTDGVLNVTVQKPESGWTSHSGEVVLTIMDGLSVDVNNTSGYISIEGLVGDEFVFETTSGKINANQLEGELDIRTKTAEVLVENVKGEVKVKTRSGVVTVNNVEGNVNVYTSSGEVFVDHVKGSLSTDTTDGKQTVKNIEGKVFVKTNSGIMKLSDSNGELSSMSAAGPLNLFNVTGVFNMTSTKGDIIGTRVQLTANSNFNTTEGKIKIKFANDKEELTLDCKSENSYIVAFGNSKKKKNKFGKGALVVTAVSTTGAQSYY